ncbi:MAG: response regulator transcription factor [Schaedlerella sp.]|uniref:response regulator transcription factor n=1 Tax=Schaedlerella sp. TaxID=2676057 RepID=UPI00265E0D9C|nr:response regulator transcription factor [uncultured Schaedlerella sp.]
MMEIYYVEDDENISRSVSEFLGKYGYRVSVFPTIADAKQALKQACPTLMLVDWNMPDGNGNLLVRWIRANWKELPIMFLTVRGDSCDVISGFQNGADDYVTKPFELDVLLLRISALLRRTGDVSGQYLSCDSIALDQKRMLVFCDTEEICLSPLEYQVLFYLLRHKGKTVTRRKLLEEIWDINGNYVNDNTLTVTIKRLREKLHQPLCLKTVRSVGYRMEDSK